VPIYVQRSSSLGFSLEQMAHDARNPRHVVMAWVLEHDPGGRYQEAPQGEPTGEGPTGFLQDIGDQAFGSGRRQILILGPDSAIRIKVAGRRLEWRIPPCFPCVPPTRAQWPRRLGPGR
jgi:hypothetical protein